MAISSSTYPAVKEQLGSCSFRQWNATVVSQCKQFIIYIECSLASRAAVRCLCHTCSATVTALADNYSMDELTVGHLGIPWPVFAIDRNAYGERRVWLSATSLLLLSAENTNTYNTFFRRPFRSAAAGVWRMTWCFIHKAWKAARE